MDRTKQEKAVTDLIQPTFDAHKASDAASDRANGSGNALAAAQRQYNLAWSAFVNRTGTGAAVDAALAACAAAQAAQPVDFQAATDAHLKFTGLWTQLRAAVDSLLVDPGAVEQV